MKPEDEEKDPICLGKAWISRPADCSMQTVWSVYRHFVDRLVDGLLQTDRPS